MRHQLGFASPTNGVTRLLIAIIATYLITAILSKTTAGYYLYSHLLLDPYSVIFQGQVWRIFTYAFLHDLSSPMHVILNSLMLYMMGPNIENIWGEKRFNIFICVAILLGGLFVLLAYLLNLSSSLVLGFSAASVGLLIAWGLNFPRDSIYIFAILPVTGKQMVVLTIGLEILYAFSSSSVSSSAHFGGIVAAFIFVFGLYKPANIKFYFRTFKNRRKFK